MLEVQPDLHRDITQFSLKTRGGPVLLCGGHRCWRNRLQRQEPKTQRQPLKLSFWTLFFHISVISLTQHWCSAPTDSIGFGWAWCTFSQFGLGFSRHRGRAQSRWMGMTVILGLKNVRFCPKPKVTFIWSHSKVKLHVKNTNSMTTAIITICSRGFKHRLKLCPD